MPNDIKNVHVKPLSSRHDRGAFSCSNPTIQNYCRFNVRRNNDAYMVRAFVACEGDSLDVLGFYYLCLTSYKVGRIDETADAKFGRVDSVPAVYLGMIGVHSDHARVGVGKLLMLDAFTRTLEIARHAGTYALTLDALDEDLAAYYQGQYGFQRFADAGLSMFLPLKTIQDALSVAVPVYFEKDQNGHPSPVAAELG